MPLLDYTTKVPASRTIGQIQGILAGHGANAILIEYGDRGEIIALSFKVKTPSGETGIKLPIDSQATFRVMERQAASGDIPKHFVSEAQAYRVAWRNVKDWIEAQMALLETEMVKMEQIFLPYVIGQDGKTLYQVAVEANLLTMGAMK